jgi:D-alanyl-D-alanine carboxypeptidase
MKSEKSVLVIRRILLSRFLIIAGIVCILLWYFSVSPLLAYSGDSKTPPAQEQTKAHLHNKEPKTHVKRLSRGVQAKAVYCVNVKNKETLIARNPDKLLPVASLTKLVTALVALDHMPLDRKVTVPGNTKKIPKSVVGLKPGDRVTVTDLLHGLLISSGNDCAETLAHAFPGGRAELVRAMNRKVRGMGTRHTVFYNPSGLDIKAPRSKEGDVSGPVRANLSTAREMALIARVAFSNKTIRNICRKKSYVMTSANHNGYRIKTTNRLLRYNLPVIGGKTGYTSLAGHCLASEFTPGRDVFVIVVLGSPDHFRDTRLVYEDALHKSRRSHGDNIRKRRSEQFGLGG